MNQIQDPILATSDRELVFREFPLADIPREIRQAAFRRAKLHDDPCAEFTLPNGWTVIAHTIVEAEQELIHSFEPVFVTAYRQVEPRPAFGSDLLSLAFETEAATFSKGFEEWLLDQPDEEAERDEETRLADERWLDENPDFKLSDEIETMFENKEC